MGEEIKKTKGKEILDFIIKTMNGMAYGLFSTLIVRWLPLQHAVVSMPCFQIILRHFFSDSDPSEKRSESLD